MSRSPVKLLVCFFLAAGVLACSLPGFAGSTTTPTQQPTTLQTQLPPQVTPTLPVIPTPTQSQPPTQPLPTATQPILPTQTNSTANTAVPTPVPISGQYSVVLVAANDVLNVRQNAGVDQSIVDKLAPDAAGIRLTGNQTTLGDQRWIEIQTPGGKQGWVNAFYLTEAVPPATFCTDTRVDTLLADLKNALVNRDGEKLRSLVSPAHGISLTYLRGATVANYSQEEAGWLFQSTYETNWGPHPGSGMELKGTFSGEVLPKLLEVLNSSYTKTCNALQTGGTTYTAVWPSAYKNINFISLHKPGTPGTELDWRTWLVGIEYVNGKPVLFSLDHLMWEP